MSPPPAETPPPHPADHDPGRPELPPGYQAQQAWGFRGASGEFFYEFTRVFAPAEARDGRGEIARLDENRSYWSTFAPISEGVSSGPAAVRWVTFEQAHQRRGGGFTFARFSSMQQRPEELATLFRGH